MHKSKEKRILKAVCSYLPDLLLREIAAKDPFDPSAVILLSGGLLQADASGFTRMSERLSQIGSRGAEELTEIFNRFFSHMLKIVFANGGDVLKFGGDSLLVFFQGEKGPWRAAVTATQMQKRMGDFRSVSTSCGTFQLALHIGINAGEFAAASLGDPGEKLELAVLGRNVALTIRCNETAGPGETLLTQSCYRRLRGKVQVSEKRGEFRKLHLLKGRPKASAQPSRRKVREERLRQLSQTLVPYLPRGIYNKIESEPARSFVESEHRKITIVFLNLIYSEKLLEGVTGNKRKSSATLRECFKAVQTLVAEHGGVITRVDPYSDGDKVLILFGAPVAQEDDEERAIRCALRIREKLKSQGLPWHGSIAQRTGINTGNAFCGEVGSRDRKEYTVMGKDVNLAARLMSKAHPGQILVSERTFTTVSSAFGASELKVKAKGITQPLRAFKIKDAVNRPAALSRRKNNTNGQTPLFGRKREIGRINRMIAKVAGGQAQILSIKGEAGIGKSRLTEELMNLCTDKGMNGVLVDCHFYGSNTPLLPWIEVLRNHWGLADNDESEEKTNRLVQALEKIDSVRWAPLFNDLLGISVAENEWTKSLEGKTRRQILFETITGLIIRHIKGAATYLVFEDTHWIDQTSTELLSHFARHISGHPVFLVLVHRPELRLRCLEGMEDYQEMLLGELSQEDAFDLARSHLEIAKLPDQIAKLAWEKSRGNPLYLQELMHSLRDSGHLIWNQPDERYELSAQASQIKIPDTVQDVITSRIDRLDETARKVIKTASVIGRVFSLGTLSSVLPFPLSRSKLRFWLEYLDKLDLVPSKNAEPYPQYMFKHALTQEVAYNLLPFAQKKNLHLKIGDHYEKKFKAALDEKCELLAHHYDNSPDLNKAFTYLTRAGNKGRRGYSNQEAIEFFNRAERTYELNTAEAKQRYRIRQASARMSGLLENRGEVYRLIGEYSQAEKDFLALLDLAKKARNRAKQSRALNLLGELCWLRSDYPASQGYVEQAYRISVSQKEDRGLAMCFNNFGDLHRRQGSFEKASESYRCALGYYKKLQDDEGVARSYNNIGISNWSRGSLTEAAKYFERALRVRREGKDKVGEAKTSNNLALIYQDRGDLPRALEMLGNALEIFRRIGDKRNAGYCLGNMGTIYRSQAKFSAALRSFEDSVQIFSEIGDEHALTYSIGNIGDVQLRMGKLKEAKKRYDQTLLAAKRLGDEELESETLSRFGTYHLLSCEPERSETCFKKALALAERIGSNEFVMKALAGLTELELHMSRHQDALKASQRLLTTAQGENMQEYVARGYLLRGMSRAALRAVQQAESDLKKAQEIAAEVGFPEISYQVHLELAKLSHSLSAAAGHRHSIAAEDQLTQAKKTLEDIASQIEEQGDGEAFLSSRMAELRSSVGKSGPNAPSAPKVHA